MFHGIIFDIDGVLEYQGRVYPGALETLRTLRENGRTLRFLTNSTLKSRASAAAKLRQRGFDVVDEEVITASYATAMYLREQGIQSVWVLLEREGLDEFRAWTPNRVNPEYIVIGDNRSQFNFDTLNHALRLLSNGARLIGMISELVDSSLGALELNVGSWVRMLETASGVAAVYIGKPNPYVFELALRDLHLPRQEVLVVGDRMSSDVVGAHGVGLRAALVRTGEFRPAHLEGTPPPAFQINAIEEVLRLALE